MTATEAASPRPAGDVLLEATDLYRFYHAGDDETLALRGVSIVLRAGEITSVTGPSGSGKSTLLACLAGLDEPDGGAVRIGTDMMSRRGEADRARLRARSIGILFQSGNLVDHLTVEQNIVLAQRLAGNVDRAAASQLLDSFGLRDRAKSSPPTLSGGEAARAGLAVALANDPSVILADEPTGELDDGTATRLMDLLRERADGGAAVLVVTHDLDLAAGTDRRIALHDGSIDTERSR